MSDYTTVNALHAWNRRTIASRSKRATLNANDADAIAAYITESAEREKRYEALYRAASTDDWQARDAALAASAPDFEEER
jgi:hypothetical protein